MVCIPSVAGASLHAYGDGQPNGVNALTDAEGRFTLQGVCPGGVNVEVNAGPRGEGLSAMVFTDGGAADIKIIVRKMGNRLIQRIRNRSYEQILAGGAKDRDADLRKWVADSKIPFPVGMIQGDREEVLFTWSARSLPWLVLTNATHVVTAEGFALSALDERLEANMERGTK